MKRHPRKDERAHFAKWRRDDADAIDRNGEAAEASATASAYEIVSPLN